MMWGLIVKDFCILWQRKNSFLIIGLCGLCMSFSTDASFFVGWLVMVISFFTISVIAYDEYDNCFPFLMSLPLSRKDYAVEKYVFGLICSFAAWVFASVIYFIVSAIKGLNLVFWDELFSLLMVLFMPVLMLDFCIPFNLKYGSQKARLYIMIFFGFIFALIMLVSKLFPHLPKMPAVNISNQLIIIFIILFVVIVSAVSLFSSIKIMEKKEF